MTKTARQSAIVEIVQRQPVAGQEELRRMLLVRGFDATQATLSRDIRDLGLVKTVSGYAVANAISGNGVRQTSPDRLIREFVREVRQAQNMIVLKTNAGSAQPVAVVIDQQNWPELVGTVGGDDTILCVCADKRAASRLAHRVREAME
jgi:transcriptional regulator of arginine metabolism